MRSPAPSTVGSEFAPLVGPPSIARLTGEMLRQFEEVVEVRHVLARKMALEEFVWFVTRLPETEANAMKLPSALSEGPDVASVRPMLPFWQLAAPPQIPSSACEPSGAISTSIGRPAEIVGVTAKVSVLEVPPSKGGLRTDGGLNTCTSLIPALARSAAVSAAETCVALVNTVMRGAPLIRITESGTKSGPGLAPLTVIVALVPACAVAGLSELMTGKGLVMLNATVLEFPPPAGGKTSIPLTRGTPTTGINWITYW